MYILLYILYNKWKHVKHHIEILIPSLFRRIETYQIRINRYNIVFCWMEAAMQRSANRQVF